ncbi:olfactory receptor 6N1-like [Rhinatrema bivittatum]|uniref:olfactory receptor 6N1-like n=1 Tax=Rhinatrema bivittatum TaxID=194408 RepID=UPI001128B89E|nr:olfactory receptor 6N1-like [Rhinatrema bivittatum]
MDKPNHTVVSEFFLLGFQAMKGLQIPLFCIFLAFYILTITSNLAIIAIVKGYQRLHTPMYFFLGNFSLLEILYTTVTVPRMLADLLMEHNPISSKACIVQFYFLFVFGATENLLLAVMAYDRYVAICRPLHYPTIMTSKACSMLASTAWLGGILAPALPALWISSLVFCSPNEIDHFCCDFAPLLKLSCTDTSTKELTFLVLAWVLILGCFLLIMASYGLIIFSILRIPSTEGQKKAFSTCASHLTVVGIFYGTVMFMYIRPTSRTRFHLDKVVSVFYTVITPVLNPIIYSLRNQEVKGALRRAMQRFCALP